MTPTPRTITAATAVQGVVTQCTNERVGAALALEVVMTVIAGEYVRLSVADSGPGIPPEDREAVFDRFSRGTSTPARASSSGTGLGLALVRDHVLAHGGACWYEDADTGGACFVVEMPGVGP